MSFYKVFEQLFLATVFCGILGATVAGIQYLEAEVKPAAFLNKLSLFKKSAHTHDTKCAEGFFEGTEIRKTIVALIDSTTSDSRILVTAYMLTDEQISTALLNRHKQGTKIIIITDSGCAVKPWSKIPLLVKNGVEVYLFPPPQELSSEKPPIMHNKFIIFENTPRGTITVTGSYNCTTSAAEKNEENIIVVDDPCVAEKYVVKFFKLIERSVRALPRPSKSDDDYKNEYQKMLALVDLAV